MSLSNGIPGGAGGPSGGVGGPSAGGPAKQKPKQKNKSLKNKNLFWTIFICYKNIQFIFLTKRDMRYYQFHNIYVYR